jgi:hypothetical protein
LIKQDKEGNSILIKDEIHQKEITIINLYASNVNAPNFIIDEIEGPKSICRLQHSGSERF